MAKGFFTRSQAALLLLVLQVVFIVLFATFIDYGESASPRLVYNDNDTMEVNDSPRARNPLHDFYPMFQDVHVMIFIGFGLLMMFLKRYGFSSVGLNMLIAALCIEWATLIGGLIHSHGSKFTIDVKSMLAADFASASVLITFGALLGKTTPMQMIIITLIEIVMFSINEYIGVVLLQAVDIGGSMFVHAFGAYFGLTVSRILHREDVESSKKEGSVYHSDMFAIVGSIFLWLFWPSFNSALAVDDAQHRAVLNTYFALAASCVTTFAISSLMDKHGRFDMVHIQNATLAGGVAVGTTADMIIQPYGALLIGSIAGGLSVIGYTKITPFLTSKLKIHDTCGVNNLHGMPAILAGIAGAITVALADQDTYGYTLYRQFPAMAPNASSSLWTDLKGHVDAIPGQDRSAGTQAAYQMLALGITLAFAIVGGLLVGLLLKVCTFLGQPFGPHLFEDGLNWHLPDEEESGTVISDQEMRDRDIQNGAGKQSVSLLRVQNRNGDS